MTTHTEPVAAHAATVDADSPAPRRHRERGVLNVLSHGFLVLWTAMVVLPLLWAMLTGVKSTKEIFNHPWGLPGTLRWSNFVDAWSKAHIGGYFVNPIIVM